MSRSIVLASTSRYRAELLQRLFPTFVTQAPDADESPLADEAPWELVERLSREKAASVALAHPNAIVIGSDQVGTLESRILTKPGSPEKAKEQLRSASGRTVHFLTGLAVHDTATGEVLSGVERVTVGFRALTDQQIESYISREQPLDCAGSFKVEGLGISLFSAVHSDDPSALQGLPLIMLTGFLASLGVDPLQ